MTSALVLPLLLLLLSVSFHACTARALFLTKKDAAKNNFYKQDLDKVKLLERSTTSSVKDYKLEEDNQAQHHKVVNNEIKICESCRSVSNLKEKIVGAVSGTSFQTDSPSFLVAKGERRHGRSMVVEETEVRNAGSDTADEDIVEMDYAQPHRKPPIHNEKP